MFHGFLRSFHMAFTRHDLFSDVFYGSLPALCSINYLLTLHATTMRTGKARGEGQEDPETKKYSFQQS